MATFLSDQGLPTIEVENVTSSEAILAACRATYGTSGLSSLRAIPDKSVDFVWSHTVLQHIRRAEFLETMRELRRQLRPNGLSSHWVDLQDCLGGSLNNLRFSKSIWESSFMVQSGFYTNRIRYSEMLGLFKEAGFEADVIHIKRWDRLPTSRSKLSRAFRNLSDEDLCVRVFHVILRPA
ncbi:MAG: class I SAM-dependent methyltransferase [Nitrospirales bacterium]